MPENINLTFENLNSKNHNSVFFNESFDKIDFVGMGAYSASITE